MINLLPPLHADTIRYGRRNMKLRRWIFAAVLANIGLILILASGWIYLNQQTMNLKHEVDINNQQLQSQNVDGVRKDAEEITGDIKVINQILSREIRFSDLISDIGTVMPKGTVLSSLTLTKANGTIDLSTKAINYKSAAQIAVNLNDPNNQLFDKVDIVNVNCGGLNEIGGQYHCSATFKALFSKEAQTKYLNAQKGGS